MQFFLFIFISSQAFQTNEALECLLFFINTGKEIKLWKKAMTHVNMDKLCYSWYCDCSNAQLDLLRPCVLFLLYAGYFYVCLLC